MVHWSLGLLHLLERLLGFISRFCAFAHQGRGGSICILSSLFAIGAAPSPHIELCLILLIVHYVLAFQISDVIVRLKLILPAWLY